MTVNVKIVANYFPMIQKGWRISSNKTVRECNRNCQNSMLLWQLWLLKVGENQNLVVMGGFKEKWDALYFAKGQCSKTNNTAIFGLIKH